MVSRENAVIGVCIVAALAVGAVVYQTSGLPSWAAFAAVLFVGVVLPTLINEYADGENAT